MLNLFKHILPILKNKIFGHYVSTTPTINPPKVTMCYTLYVKEEYNVDFYISG